MNDPRNGESRSDAGLAIEASGLRKSFGKTQAVQGLDLQVRRGEVFGLLGPNGAGKTTSMEMLEGLSRPDAGEVRIFGRRWQDDHFGLRCRVGVQFQSTELDDHVRVREALQMFAAYYPKARSVEEMLALVQLQDKADSFQRLLSGGQRQRLALALALINDPELVFLDEPTTGLDPQARQGLWQLVRQLKAEGRTVLITTHYMDEAEALCDRVGIMDQGRILRVGTPRELIAELQQPGIAELEFEGTLPAPGPASAELGLDIQAGEGHWAVRLRHTQQDLQRLLALLDRLQLPMTQLHVRRPSLEDVFLHQTGRSLRD